MTTTLIQIKHCQHPDQVIFECHVPNDVKNKMKYAVEEAVRQKKSLAYADLRGAYLSGADLLGADLSHANLSHANLSHATLSCVDISHSQLRCVDLSYANLSHANLSHANLSYADISHSQLHMSGLHNTDFYHVNLSHATFIFSGIFDSSFQCANFHNTKIDGEVVSKPPMVVGGGLRWPVLITEGYMKIGCQRHKHGEWKSFNDEQISDMDKDALEFWNRYSVVLISMCDIQSK